MSDYDAAFAAAVQGPAASPYDDVMKSLMAQVKPTQVAESAPTSVKAGAAINDNLNSIPRQLGLTARYGLEGLANTAQIATEPIRYLTDRLTGQTGKTLPLGELVSRGLDSLGMPKPEGANERVIGDAARLVAGSGGMGAAAGAARGLPGALGQAGSFLSANIPQQLASAAGAGLAGGASREAGASPIVQAGASLAGGVAGGLVPGAASGAYNAGKRLLTPAASPQQLDQQISVLLNRAGVDYSQIPAGAQASLRQELASALQAGKELDPQAVARLADFKATGLTPTRGMVSQNPVQITREMNLAKMGANSSDEGLQGLSLVQNQNNAKLIGGLNSAGANQGDPFRAGQAAIGSINARDAAAKSRVSGLYQQARDMPGGDTPLDSKTLVDNIYGELAKQNKMAFLPKEVSDMIDQFSLGQITRGGKTFPVPFDANALDNLMTTVATAQRGTMDGNVKAALSAVRKAIDSTPILPMKTQYGGNQLVTDAGAQFLRGKDAQAGQFMGALNDARQAAAQRFGWQESARPIEAALKGAQPDKFVQQFVIGGTLDDAQAVAKNAPLGEIKNAILAHLKEKSLNGASDEIGKFSQSAYNKALGQIGERKLGLFFAPEELAQLKAIGRVASYAQNQPVGSAVNNSNSGALLLGRGYDALKGLAGKMPFGQSLLLDPIKNIEIGIRSNQAQNVMQGLLAPTQRPPIGQGLLLPGMAVGGLLAAP